MRINSAGTVNIFNTLQIAGTDIDNFLFNNTGRNHSTYTDFNAIDKFWYTYIQAGTNNPNILSRILLMDIMVFSLLLDEVNIIQNYQ